MTSPAPTVKHDEVEAQLSDYADGSLGPDAQRMVEEHLATCAECRATLAELRATVSALSGLHRMSAPEHFDREVAETIRRRSRGRFFGRRALGDRIPFELLALLALGLGVGLYFFLRGSDTGSFRPLHREPTAPAIHQDAPGVVPRP